MANELIMQSERLVGPPRFDPVQATEINAARMVAQARLRAEPNLEAISEDGIADPPGGKWRFQQDDAGRQFFSFGAGTGLPHSFPAGSFFP
jgi:hypothetical protein